MVKSPRILKKKTLKFPPCLYWDINKLEALLLITFLTSFLRWSLNLFKVYFLMIWNKFCWCVPVPYSSSPSFWTSWTSTGSYMCTYILKLDCLGLYSSSIIIHGWTLTSSANAALQTTQSLVLQQFLLFYLLIL